MSQSAEPTGFRAFLQKFTGLRSAPRELWIIFVANIFENLAYKVGAAGVLTLWLSSDLGYNDTSAGAMVAVWSAIMTLVTALVGSLTDALGIRKTFLLGFWLCLCSRIVMTITAEVWVVIPFGLYVQAVGIALLIPVMAAACRRYTNAFQRSVAFALYYALVNLGYAIGDIIFDYVRAVATKHSGVKLEHTAHVWSMSWDSIQHCPYQMLMFLSVVFTIPGLILVWFTLRDGVEMTEAGVRIHPKLPNRNAAAGKLKALYRTAATTASETWRVFSSLWGQKSFYRFLLFMTLVVGVRMIFYHLAYTFPKYSIRELGDGAPFAHLSGMMNSMMVVVLVPICGALTQKISAYRMVTWGSLVSSLSVFLLVVPARWFQPLADSGAGNLLGRWLEVDVSAHPLWVSMFLFVALLSIGEAFWSPRLFEYAAAIAPKGQEASYMALSVLPYFVGKFTVGLSSGWLLKWYCPAEGPRNSGMMWFIIGCTALITPLGTFLFRKHLQLQESGREPVITKAEAAVEEEEGHV